MANGSIKFDVGFNTNLKGLNEAKKALAEIQKLTTEDIKMYNLNDDLSGLNSKLKNAREAANEFSSALNSAFNVNLGALDLTQFNKSVQSGELNLQSIQSRLTAIGPAGQKAFRDSAFQIMNTNLELTKTQTILDKMAVTMGNTIKWGISSSIMKNFSGAVQKAYGYVKDLDSSLNDIRIVSGQSAEQMDKFAKNANKAAQELGSSTNAYAKASLIYYQQGLSDSEVTERTNATIKMSNVLGESAKEVSSYMTAIWNNFDDGSESLEHYGDVITALGANTASSAAEIAEGLEKFAAVADTVGLSYEYATASLATVVAETRQSADIVGTAFKTLFARIQDLELGDTLDDGTTLGKYSQALEAVGINIKDSNGELKDMNSILDEMGAKWNTLSKDTQVALAQTVAGTRQYTQLVALMDNWDKVQKNVAVAEGSDGTLEKQQAIYMESAEAHIQKLRTAWEDFYSTVFDVDAIKGVTDALTGVIKLLTAFTESIGGGRGALLLLGSVATNVFSKNIANGLGDIILKFKKVQLEEQNAAAMSETINMFGGLKEKDEVFDNILDKYKSIYQYSQNLTDEDKKQVSELMNSYKLLQEQEKATKDIKDRLNDSLGAAGFSKGVESIDSTNAYHAKGAISSFTAKTRSNLTDNSFMQDEFPASEKLIEDFDKISNYLTDNIENIKKFASGNQDAADAADVLRETLERLGKDKNNISQEDFETVKTQLKELDVEIVKASESAKQNIINASKGAYKSVSEDIDGISNQLDQKVNNLSLKDQIQSISQLSSGVLSLGMALSSLGSLSDIWSNEDMSVGEKMLKTIMSMSMAINGLTRGLPAAKKAFEGIGSAVKNFIPNLKASTMAAIKERNEVAQTNLAKKQTVLEATKIALATTRETKASLENAQAKAIEAMQIKKVAAEKAKESAARAKVIESIWAEKAANAKPGSTKQKEAQKAQKIWSAKAIEQETVATRLLAEAEAEEAGVSEFAKKIKEQELKETALLTAEKEAELGVAVAETEAKAAEAGMRGINTTAEGAETMGLWALIQAKIAEMTIDWKKLAIYAAIAAIIAVVIAAVKAYQKAQNAEAEAAAKAAEATEKSKERYEDLKSAYEDLKDTLADYSDARKGIDELTKGTDAWKEAVQELNAKVLDLLHIYPELAKYITNEDGVLTISEEGMNNVLKQQYSQVIAAQGQYVNAQNEELKLSSKQSKKHIQEYGANNYESMTDIQVNTLLSAYQEQGNAIFASTEELQKATGFSRMLSSQLINNADSVMKAIESIEANSAAIDANSDALWTSMLEDSDVYNNIENENLKDIVREDGESKEAKNQRKQYAKDIYKEAKGKHGSGQRSLAELTAIAAGYGEDAKVKDVGGGSFKVWDEEKKDWVKIKYEDWEKETKSYIDSSIANGTLDSKYYDLAGLDKSDVEKNVSTDGLVEKYTEAYNKIVDAVGQESADNFLKAKNSGDFSGLYALTDEEVAQLEAQFADLDLSEFGDNIKEEFQQAIEDRKSVNVSSDLILFNKQTQFQNENGSSFSAGLKGLYEGAISGDLKLADLKDSSFYQNIDSLKEKYSDLYEDTYLKLKENLDLITNTAKYGTDEWYAAVLEVSQIQREEQLNSLQAKKAELLVEKEIAEAVGNIDLANQIQEQLDDIDFEINIEVHTQLDDLKKEWSEISNNIDEVQDAYSTLNTVIEDYNDNGHISVDNFQQLMELEPEYIACLDASNGILSLNKDAVKDLAKAKLELAKANVTATYTTLIESEKENGDEEKAREYEQSLANILALYNSINLDDLFGSLGGGSSDADNKKEYIVNRYEKIDRAVQKLTDTMSELENQESRLIGSGLLDNLEEQTSAIEAQTKAYQKKLEIEKAEASRLRNSLSSTGYASFDGNGNLNYNAYMANITNAFNNGDITDAEYQKYQQYADNYVQVWEQSIQETEQQIKEMSDKAFDIALKKLNVKVDMQLDTSELDRKYNEWYQDVIKNRIGEDSIGKTLLNAELKSLNSSTYQDSISSLIDNILSKQGLYQQLLNGDTSINQASVLADLKNYQDKLIAVTREYKQLVEDAHKSYIEAIDNWDKAMKNVLDDYENISKELQHAISLTKLLFGDDTYAEQNNYLEKSIANSEKQLAYGYAQLEKYRNNMEQALAQGDQEAYESFKEKYNSLNSTLQSSLETTIQNLLTKYQNTLNQVMKDMDEKIFNNKSFKEVKDEWDRISKSADQYLDKVNSAYEVSKLQAKYTKQINATTNIDIQNKLTKALNAQTAALNAKTKLSKYDLDLANAKYELLVAQIALEEAQANKTTMRLKRDSQGNYSYVYGQDDSKVNDAQEKVDAAQANIWNIEKKNYSDLISDAQNQYKNYQDALKEAYQIKDEEARERQIKAINSQYKDIFANIGDLFSTSQSDIISYIAGQEGISENQVTNDMIKEYLPTWGSDFQTMIEKMGNSENFQSMANDIALEMQAAQNDYQQHVQEVLDLAETNVEDLKAGLYGEDDTTLSDILSYDTATAEKAEKIAEQVKSIYDEIFSEWEAFQSTYGAAIEAIQDNQFTLDELNDKTQEHVATITNAFETALNNIKNDIVNAIESTKDVNPTPGDDGGGNKPSFEPQWNTGNYGTDNNGKTITTSSDYVQYAKQNQTIQQQKTSSDAWAESEANWKKKAQKLEDYYSGDTVYAKLIGFDGEGNAILQNKTGTQFYYDLPDPKDPGKWKLSGTSNITKVAGPYSENELADLLGVDIYDITLKAKAYDTGGYTGEWNDNSGKMAILHQKELVLNASDTQNILSAVDMVRSMQNLLSGLGNMSNFASSFTQASQNMNQNVHIEASFPGVRNSQEIENALNNLVNKASQYAYSTI